jgi:transposase InsO family protein
MAKDRHGYHWTIHKNKKWLQVCLNYYATRFPEAIPLKKITAVDTAQALLQVFAVYDVPQEIVTDNGGNFTADLMEHLLKSLTIHHNKTSPYNPQANGMVERMNGVIKKALIKAGTKDKDWDQRL